MEAKVFGGVVRNHQKVIARMIGPAALEQALAKIEPELREELQNASMLSWCTQRALSALHERCSDIANIELDRFVTDVVKGSMKLTFGGVWKILFKVTSDEAIVRRAGILYSRSTTRGRLIAEITGKGRALIRLVDYPDIPHISVVATAASIEAALSVSERTQPRVAWKRVGNEIHYDVRWRPKLLSDD